MPHVIAFGITLGFTGRNHALPISKQPAFPISGFQRVPFNFKQPADTGKGFKRYADNGDDGFEESIPERAEITAGHAGFLNL